MAIIMGQNTPKKKKNASCRKSKDHRILHTRVNFCGGNVNFENNIIKKKKKKRKRGYENYQLLGDISKVARNRRIKIISTKVNYN